MLSKLLKNDLKRNMQWLWILFISTLAIAGITRGCKELGKTIAFFQIVGIFLDSIFYALAVNVVLQPFLRNFLNFTKSFYSDEAYLTHTLPVTKNQLINSKFITAIIEITLGILCLVLSILIMFASPTMEITLNLIISTIISDNFSLFLILTLAIILIIVEFLMFISIIYFSIVLAYRSKEKRILKTFLYTALLSFVSITILTIALLIILLINNIDITLSTLILPNTAAISIFITGIIVYSSITILFYFLTKKVFNKGVNVD